mgnify:CR=1 FL=1
MKNMGLHDLALVNPKYFPHDDATARASGAADVLEGAMVVDSLADALTDCVYVAGASARSRTINWPSMGPRDCAERMIQESSNGKIAAVFGPLIGGLVATTALVRPSQSVMDLKPKSVKKKWKDKRFAAGVDRTIIQKGVDMLGVELGDLITDTIMGMREGADEIGLKGRAQ